MVQENGLMRILNDGLPNKTDLEEKRESSRIQKTESSEQRRIETYRGGPRVLPCLGSGEAAAAGGRGRRGGGAARGGGGPQKGEGGAKKWMGRAVWNLIENKLKCIEIYQYLWCFFLFFTSDFDGLDHLVVCVNRFSKEMIGPGVNVGSYYHYRACSCKQQME